MLQPLGPPTLKGNQLVNLVDDLLRDATTFDRVKEGAATYIKAT
jgi:hypothetical protein